MFDTISLRCIDVCCPLSRRPRGNIGCDCHGIDPVRMAMERRYGFPRHQVPNAQRFVIGAGDRVATVGGNCHGADFIVKA
jgi:hypothetical protein